MKNLCENFYFSCKQWKHCAVGLYYDSLQLQRQGKIVLFGLRSTTILNLNIIFKILKFK